MKRQQRLLQIYDLEISLLGIKPRIWRRFKARNNHSLMILHHIIQMVMGWKDCHLHAFEINGQRYTTRFPGLDDLNEGGGRDDRRFYLRDLLGGEGFRFLYRYDYGDNWEHEVKVIRVGQPADGERYPSCEAGERACPPEDVGGVGGYFEMLEALADPRHEEHDNYLQWRGPYDSELFDLKQVNWLLGNIR